MSYGRTFPLWRAEAAAWTDYVDAPFVRALADGSLPRKAFLTYLAQDYLFLIHFARAWALATVKSSDLEEMRACSATVHALLHQEMPLHVKLCRAAGIDLETLEEAPENLAYTRYVLEAGYSGDLLDLLAALAPCVLGYGEIGARLAAAPHAPDYAEWIKTYGSAKYQALCHDTAALIDGAMARRLGEAPESLPRWREISERFATATRLEAQFWTLAR
ncbi:thiaminase II [Falsirhodobacter sp. 20TX0035]|uniref:thiaminase II n=1 Tax=Falsirhodobacter sp. 20TX0035 TaxID=3022019 RepID=UPI00232B5290|nr:thiaminase II [Falsirhodobacter sp. 20TX0035]MDB6453618.1 thiaminase II [Falsirhodobacter sp. 20TX0035]